MPRPVSPVIAGREGKIFAEGQPQYTPLPSITNPENPQGPVTSRWTFTDQERAMIACLDWYPCETTRCQGTDRFGRDDRFGPRCSGCRAELVSPRAEYEAGERERMRDQIVGGE